jgi:4-hydroxy-3-polyprenylbenzoate decarboxylase
MYQDLREFIAQVDELGALRRIAGADPRFEVGGITEVAAGLPDCPALLFDRLKGWAFGFSPTQRRRHSAQPLRLASIPSCGRSTP